MKPAKKTQFAGSNDKLYCLHNGIVSFLFGHYLLKKVREEKEKSRAELCLKIQEESINLYHLKVMLYIYVEINSTKINICPTNIIL